MDHAAIVNHYARRISNCRYLEIGVRNPHDCLANIDADVRHGVDPRNPPNGDDYRVYGCTSQEFWRRGNWGLAEYDLIFVDGDHGYDAVSDDLHRAQARLSGDGVIILHDAWPTTESVAAEKPTGGQAWCGEVWRALSEMVDSGALCLDAMYTDDHGVAVCRPGSGQSWCAESIEQYRDNCPVDPTPCPQ